MSIERNAYLIKREDCENTTELYPIYSKKEIEKMVERFEENLAKSIEANETSRLKSMELVKRKIVR